MKPFLVDVPVLILFFNRPQQLSQVFEQVRNARPSKLFLYQDGPRGEHDLPGIKACREVTDQIDWDCKVHRMYQEKNYGCDPSEYISQKWAFSMVDKCIVLEDDDVPSVSFQDLLQGNATGVQFTSASGQPGSSASLSIRGMGSFNASNSPLYVIDGVPVTSGSINSISSDGGLDAMSTVNTSDIENITIIKDAAAASLYGSRAANGVVLITTKKGKTGKASISLKADWGFSDFAMDYRPTLSGAERREYIYNGMVLGQQRSGKSDADAIAYADKNIRQICSGSLVRLYGLGRLSVQERKPFQL